MITKIIFSFLKKKRIEIEGLVSDVQGHRQIKRNAGLKLITSLFSPRLIQVLILTIQRSRPKSKVARRKLFL